VERTVREAVDDGDVQTVLVEKRAEVIEPALRAELARLACRETEPDAEPAGRRELRFEGRRDPRQVRPNRVPSVRRVNVGAVGELEKAVSGDVQSVTTKM
jgi:hypothetical protein